MFTCTTDGKNKIKEGCPDTTDHYFIILSKEEYNKNASHFLGVPLTSNFKGNYSVKYGLDISNDDLVGEDLFTKPTLILCDRPCRISRNDLTEKVPYDTYKISEAKFSEILENIYVFMRSGKRSPNSKRKQIN